MAVVATDVFDEGPGCSPILVDLGEPSLQLSSVESGVVFDINGDGTSERMSWTAPESDDAFLVFDRNADGWIGDGTELFGNFTPQPASTEPNGFLALAVYDRLSAGGDDDGVITPKDWIWRHLQLWTDHNHNGLSELAELETLEPVGASAIALTYVESRRKDRYGNELRYSSVVLLQGRERTRAIDVFLQAE